MSRRDDQVTLRHVLEYAREAIEMASGRSRADLDSDRMLELSLTRLVEIVGEAATRTSEEIQEAHAGIPWREIIAMRNRLIHGYDSVDRDILWEVVTNDLPPLPPASSRFSTVELSRDLRQAPRPIRLPTKAPTSCSCSRCSRVP